MGVKANKLSVKIMSIEANSLYAVNNHFEEAYLDLGEAVIYDSLFSNYMRHHGVAVNKRGRSKDFILMKFRYGVKNGMSVKELREYYYKNGATVTWKIMDDNKQVKKEETICYKMLMRSPGKAKEGDCIFIRDNLHDLALHYLTMGLCDKVPYHNAKIVELSAYSTLVTAAAIGYIKIPLEQILILKDQEVSAFVNAVSVKTVQQECYVDRGEGKKEVKNVLWDGMGLIDESIFPEDKGMDGFIYCRGHFFKSCLFRGEIQNYFKDYYGGKYDTARVTDMFGNQFFAKDIKVIVTDNSIKWLKFKEVMGKKEINAYRYYKRFVKKQGDSFAIVKTAHKSKYGELQRSSYQMNNSLPCMDKEALNRIAKTSYDYCNTLKTNHKAFVKYLSISASQMYSIHNVLVALDGWNEKFKDTQYFREKKNSIISKFKNDRLKGGKLLQQGDNLTICGNPIALLRAAVGQDPLEENCFDLLKDGIECYTTRFQDGEKLAGFRSPHNAPNNIVYLINVYPEKMQKYFPKLGENVIVINGIGTDVQARLNGQDLDSDSVYVTNQQDIVDAAHRAYLEYPTIINDIRLYGTSSYKNDMESYADMDNRIASSQYAIGYASNLAQLALSYYYDGGGESKELEDVFIICSVLAQVAIDSAKREYKVDVNRELSRIKGLSCMQRVDNVKYPYFYSEIQKRQKKREMEKSRIGRINCPMELLADIIEDNVKDLRHDKEKQRPACTITGLLEDEGGRGGKDGKQYKKILSIVEEYDNNAKKLDRSEDGYVQKMELLFDTCQRKLQNLTISKYTMQSLIRYAFTDSKIRDRLLVTLYDKDSSIFLKCFKKE